MTTPVRHGRLLALGVVGFVVVLVLCLGAGLGYLVFSAIHDDEPPTPGAGRPSVSSSVTAAPSAGSNADVTAQQDELAARPMLKLPPSAAFPQALATERAGPPIVIPAPTSKVVPGGPPFATGFPHTPEGALAQLAAIDEAAFSTTDLERVHEVYEQAVKPGAVPESEWSPRVGVTSMVNNLGGQQKAMAAQVLFQAVQGQIKGTVGPDFVVACVLGEIHITAATTARVGAGDCQRMVWRDGRWWIGPGKQPAYAPHAWPGSADAVRAGWRDLERA